MMSIITRARKRAAYPAYKPSGVVWLGHVPEHWEVKRAKGLLARNDGGVWGEDFDDDGVIVLRSTEQTVDGEWNIVEPARRRLTSTEYASCRLEAGDLVVTKSSGSSLHIGKTSIVTKEVEALNCCYSNFMQRLRVKRTAEPRFVWYVLNGELGRKQFDYYSSTTTGLANLNGSIIGNVGMAVPPLAEQQAIAAFLDRETARIDALVEKKRRQIELLQEKRSALISHAVTKGLDPSAPLSDSGIEWLGEVPEHWGLLQLRRAVGKFIDYRGRTPTKTETGVPLITAGAVKHGEIDHTLAPEYIAEDAYKDWMGRGLPEPGDVVITTEAPLGEVAQVGNANVAFAQRVILFKVNRRLMQPEFLRYYYLSTNGQSELLSRASGSTASGIRADRLKMSTVLVPPLPEQQAIVEHLDSAIQPLVEPRLLIAKSIATLHEHRSALISAAVTGKIDVRGEVA